MGGKCGVVCVVGRGVDLVISRELAEKLQSAGLVWEPKIITEENIGDWYVIEGQNEPQLLSGRDFHIAAYKNKLTWLPSLGQLLDKLRKRSEFVKITWLVIDEQWCCVIDDRRQFTADTPEDAAGHALLWIIKRGDRNG